MLGARPVEKAALWNRSAALHRRAIPRWPYPGPKLSYQMTGGLSSAGGMTVHGVKEGKTKLKIANFRIPSRILRDQNLPPRLSSQTSDSRVFNFQPDQKALLWGTWASQEDGCRNIKPETIQQNSPCHSTVKATTSLEFGSVKHSLSL